MTNPQFADGGDLHIWKIAANILNKQLWASDKRWSSNFALGMG
jgi:hypothetical protein